MSVAPRRRPVQDRSRRRLQAILDATQHLLTTRNPETLAMREIAREAGVPISALYQYFPSRAAVMRALVERNLGQVRRRLEAEFRKLDAEFGRDPPIAVAVGRLVDAYFSHYAGRAETIAIWAGAQADEDLRRLDQEDTRQTAALIAPRLTHASREGDACAAQALALIIAESTGHVARLALAQEPALGRAIVDQLKAMFTTRLEAFARD